MPEGISIMNPYADQETWKIVEIFYRKFYSDTHPRAFIFGINPGRFGGGVTGIPFTDPMRLQYECGIPNPWKKQHELSALFIYQMIGEFGGVEDFYGKFFITALSPLGFTWSGKNLNYYDNKELLRQSEPFILRCIRRQLETIPTADTCYCLGEGENYRQFRRINDQHGFFKDIIPLPHPRWVMQYRRKNIADYIKLYVDRLNGSYHPATPSPA